MSTLREAAQQALEALEETQRHRAYTQGIPDAITALRAALAQQEPVAWQWLNTGHFRKKLPVTAEPGVWTPLYTHPPRREWHSLTDKEIRRMGIETPGQQGGWNLAFARAIEAKLKEKNHG